MKHDQQGFTLIEITAVLVLMAIISAYVIGRSINTEQIDLAGQTDKIRNQIRYVQSTAMKRSDAIWGITCDTNQYWMFQTNILTPVLLPGEQNTQINLSDLGLDRLTCRILASTLWLSLSHSFSIELESLIQLTLMKQPIHPWPLT
jgi:prepilin-type N-terminal cleavage/methylation domain-containing protein